MSPPASSAPVLLESTRRIMRHGALGAAVVHVGFVPLFIWWGVPWLALFNVGSVAAHLFAYWQARPGGNVRMAGFVVALEVGLHAVAATLLLGWDSGFHYLMLPLLPAVMVSGSRQLPYRLGLSLVLSLTYLALKEWSARTGPLHSAPPPQTMHALEMGCIVVTLVAFVALAQRYRQLIHRAQEKLEHEASTDPLTGALNRRRLHALAHTLPQAQTSCVLLCDLDHFKQVNDVYGHDVGDAVLKAFHAQLQHATRNTDWVCRWGGEEFLVLMPDTTVEQARLLAERLRQQWGQQPLALAGGLQLPVTATCGVTELLPGERLHRAVKRADQALYAGKAAGRNRVVVVPALPPL